MRNMSGRQKAKYSIQWHFVRHKCPGMELNPSQWETHVCNPYLWYCVSESIIADFAHPLTFITDDGVKVKLYPVETEGKVIN